VVQYLVENGSFRVPAAWGLGPLAFSAAVTAIAPLHFVRRREALASLFPERFTVS
jgi:hypothetical protein